MKTDDSRRALPCLIRRIENRKESAPPTARERRTRRPLGVYAASVRRQCALKEVRPAPRSSTAATGPVLPGTSLNPTGASVTSTPQPRSVAKLALAHLSSAPE